MSHCSTCSENYNKNKQLPQSCIFLAAHSLVSSLQHKAGREVTHFLFSESINAADRVLGQWNNEHLSHPIPSHPHPIPLPYWKFAVSSAMLRGQDFSLVFSWSRLSNGSQPSSVWLATRNVHKPSNNSWVQRKPQWLPCSWDSTSPLSLHPPAIIGFESTLLKRGLVLLY